MTDIKVGSVYYMPNEISWEDVEVGKKYKYEEGYDLQAKVLVKHKREIDDETHDNYIEMEIMILEVYGGFGKDSFEYGDEITIGKSLTVGNYLTNKHKFLTLDSNFTYVGV